MYLNNLDSGVTQAAYLATWFVNTVYFAALIPQIFLNWRLRSTMALSDLMLFGYALGCISETIYAFCLNMPLSYRTMLPLSYVAIMIIIYQRFFYRDQYHLARLALAFLCISSLLVWLLVHFFAHLGVVFGWVSTIVWTVYGVPQVIKNYQRKSVHGFSLLFVCISAVGALTEFISSLILSLPMPTVVRSARGLVFIIVFVVQFMWYRNYREVV